MPALVHLIKKEIIQLRRNRAMLAISFGVPIVQLLVLGMAISGDVERVPAAVTDLDNSAASRSLVSKIESTRYLDVVAHPETVKDGHDALERGDAVLYVTIPRDFSRDIVRRKTPAVSVMSDAQNTNVALTGTGYIRRIVQSWAVSERMSAHAAGATTGFINAESRIWYNQELKSLYFMITGILVLLVTIITMLLTAFAIVREREQGTLEQLMVSPLTRVELILGKTIPFAVIGMIELGLALSVGKAVYHIPTVGSLPLFFGVGLLYIFCVLGIGILISTMTHTQQQALFMAWFFLMFFLLMSGFLLPLENIPRAVYFLTYANPLRYFMTVVREVFLKGAGAADLVPQITAIAGMAVLTLTVAVIRFNKRLG